MELGWCGKIGRAAAKPAHETSGARGSRWATRGRKLVLGRGSDEERGERKSGSRPTGPKGEEGVFPFL